MNFSAPVRKAKIAIVERLVSGPVELLGKSSVLEQLRGLVRKVSRTDATVLVRGEPGTGKKLLARMIHNLSARAEGPFIHFDCASMPENLLDSALFGADADADAAHAGAFELANGGTLLLEEVAALPLISQSKVLGVLEGKETEVDGAAADSVKVRLIATTSRDLLAKVQQKEFREELFHALNIVPIQIPPLRERTDDIPLLAEHFRQFFARKHGSNVLAISPACMSALQQYPWPGNTRELQSVIECAVISCQGGVLEAAHLNFTIPTGISDTSAETPAGHETLGEAEKRHIFAVLTKCDGNRTHAAKRLGISIRTLRNKLREYRLQENAGDGQQDNETESEQAG